MKISTDEQLAKVWAEMPARFGFSPDIDKFWRMYKCYPNHYCDKRMTEKIRNALYDIAPDLEITMFTGRVGAIIAVPLRISKRDFISTKRFSELPIHLGRKWDVTVFPAREINIKFTPEELEANPDLCTLVLTERKER